MERKIRWRDKYSEDFEEQLVVQATEWTFPADVNEHLTSNVREGFHSTGHTGNAGRMGGLFG